jgi:nicotinamidase-related amidase
MNPILAEKAALLVVDVQAGLFNAQPSPFEGPQVIDKINLATAKARAAKVPVFFTQQDGEA